SRSPAARDARATELAGLSQVEPEEVLHISAKTGEGVADLLRTVIEQVPHPVGDPAKPLQALIFDSMFDIYRGVITYVRIQEGTLPSNARVRFMATHVESDAEE